LIESSQIISKPYFCITFLKNHIKYIMSVLVNKDSKIIVQGFTGSEGTSLLK
jgi:hypothetical protein